MLNIHESAYEHSAGQLSARRRIHSDTRCGSRNSTERMSGICPLVVTASHRGVSQKLTWWHFFRRTPLSQSKHAMHCKIARGNRNLTGMSKEKLKFHTCNQED
ncbi:a1.1 [Tranosema rostrale ichnovirus]|nr:a1.1 [Tranosema rostrale ichnovirus]